MDYIYMLVSLCCVHVTIVVVIWSDMLGGV